MPIVTRLVDTEHIIDGAITTEKLAALSITSEKIAADAIIAAKIAAGAVEAAKIAVGAVTDEKVLKWMAGKSGTSFPLSPTDGELFYRTDLNKTYRYDSAGVAWLPLDAIDSSTRLADGIIVADKIATNAVTAGKILAGAVETDKLAALAVTAEKIAALAITTDKLAALAVTAEKIAALTITADKIAALAITAAKIAADTITADKYNQLRNTYIFDAEDSLDATYPFTIPFKIASEMAAIQAVKLSFKILNFRAYSTGVPSGGGSTTPSGGGSTTPSGGGSTSGSSGTPHRHTIAFSTTWNGDEKPIYASLGSLGCDGTGTVPTSSVDAHTHTFTLVQQASGSQASTNGGDPSNLGCGSALVWRSDVVNGHQHEFTITGGIAGTYTLFYKVNQLRGGASCSGTLYTTYALESHTHTTPAHVHTTPDHTHSTPAHAHALTFGIYEEVNSPTIHYHIDNGAGYGAASADYTTDQLELDITLSISGTGWKAIRFDTTARCRIYGIIECKIDIDA